MILRASYYEQPSLWGHTAEPYQAQNRADVLDLLPADVQSVLDVGCGDGLITNALPRDLEVVGADISREALQYVQRSTTVASITELPFDNAEFDLVLTMDVLEHLHRDDLAVGLRELGRVARKYVLICVPHGEQLEANQARCGQCGKVYHIHDHQTAWTEDRILRLLPAPWRPREVRYSGAFRVPPDPTVRLRQQLGLWKVWGRAQCPACGSHKQVGEAETMSTVAIDGVCADVWWDKLGARNRYSDRSEILCLFERSTKAVEWLPAPEIATVSRSPLSLAFANRLAAATEWVAAPVLSKFHLTQAMEQTDDGLAVHGRPEQPITLEIRVPTTPEKDDALVVTGVALGETANLTFTGVDALTGVAIALGTATLTDVMGSAKVPLPDAWTVDRLGMALLIQVHHPVRLVSFDIEKASSKGVQIPWIKLEVGHNLVTTDVGAIRRSWGYFTKETGELPMPSWSLDSANTTLATDADLAVHWRLRIENAWKQTRDKVERLRGMLEQKERERSNTERFFASAQHASQELETQIANLQKLLSEKEIQRDKTEQLCHNAQVQLGALESKRSLAENACAEAHQQLAQMQTRMSQLNELLEDREAKRSQAEGACVAAQQQLAQMQERMAHLNALLEDRERQRVLIEERTTKLNTMLEEKERQRDHAEAACRNSEMRLLDLNRMLEDKEVSRSRAEESYSQLFAQQATLEKNLAKTKENLKTTKRIADTLTLEVEQLRTSEARIIADREEMRLRAEVMQSRLEIFDRNAKRRAHRILVLSHMFPHPDQPISGPFVHEQVKALRDFEGVDARVVSGRPFWVNTRDPKKIWGALRYYQNSFASLKWEEHDGVPVLYLPYLVGHLFPFPLHGTTYKWALAKAQRWLAKQFSVDLVHAHTAYTDGSAGAYLSRKLKVPFVITEHTGPFSILSGRYLIRRQTLANLRRANRVWCVSDSLAREVKSFFSEKEQRRMKVLFNGVNTAAFSSTTAWNPRVDAPRLLSVTGFEEVKDPFTLVNAFAQFHANCPGATLTVVGYGSLEAQVRARVADLGLQNAIRLVGRQPREEVARLMREECDVFMLSSKAETFGVVLIEAMASGKPIVATRCGGPDGIITSPLLGELAEVGNPASLAQTLTSVCKRLDRFQPEFIRRHAVETYDFRVIARTLIDDYQFHYRNR